MWKIKLKAEAAPWRFAIPQTFVQPVIVHGFGRNFFDRPRGLLSPLAAKQVALNMKAQSL